jgi:hypothetical protein
MDYEDGFDITRTVRHNPLLSFAGQHLVLLASIVGALIFTIRCVAVTEGDPYTASILLTQTSLGDGLRLLLFSLAPRLLILVSYVAAFVAAFRKGWRDPATVGLLAVSLITTIGHLYLSGSLYVSGQLAPNWWFGVALFSYWCATLFLVPRWFIRVQRVKPAGLRVSITRGTVLASMGMFLVLLGPLLASDNFWLPPERLIFANEAPFTGYVLRAGEDRLVILNDDPRIVVQMPKAALRDRDFCYPEGHKARSSKVAADSPACP